MLAGIQYDQHLARRQRLGDRRHRVVAWCDGHTSGGGDRRCDEGRVVDRAEVDVADVAMGAGGNLDGEPGFAGSPRAGECQRAVTFDEDRSQVRCGSIPQVMAALRNTAIGLLRRAGHTNIAAACRRLAAQPAQALALIGIVLEN